MAVNTSSHIERLVHEIRNNTASRREAFTALVDLQTPESTSALLNLIADYRVPPYYPAMLNELGKRHMLDPLPYFRDILLDKESSKNTHGNQLTVVSLLSEYPHHDMTIPLLTLILKKKEHTHILRECVYSLGQIGTEEAVYVLSLVLQDYPDSKVQHDSLMVLGSTKHHSAAHVLMNYLEQAHHTTNDNRTPPNCINAMNGLFRLWKANVRPFDVTRWIELLNFWLYWDDDPDPKVLYVLKKMTDIPQAQHIIDAWATQQSTFEEALLNL